MKRIRINNDFTFAWAIERNGLPEDLSTAINMVLLARNSTGAIQVITDYEVVANMVSVEITPEIANVLGRYNFILTYKLPDASLDDMERLCEVDTDAFIIVPRTAEADDSTDLLVTSDMAIGFKGDPFLYSDFTPEQLEALKVKGDTGNGIQSITLLSTVGLVKTYRITYTNGTTYDYTVTDGAGGGGGIDLSAYLTELEAQGLYQPVGDYLTDETDPTVPAWAKEATKPTYTAAEVSGLQTALDGKVDDSQVLTNVPSGALFTDTVYTHPATHEATIIAQDATHRFVTDTEKTTWSGKADAIHNHDDRYYTEGEVNGLISAIKGAYDAELVTSPTTGTLTLKNATETVLDGALTTSNVFTVALPTPVSGKVNESVLIFKIGATLPTITQPSGIVWRGSTPTLAINTSWTIVYEQINTTGSTYEIWAIATKNA